MSRYFIHIQNGTGLQRDDVGGDFASPALAIGEAAKMAGEILRGELRDGLGDRRLIVRVEGEEGNQLGEITLALSVVTPT